MLTTFKILNGLTQVDPFSWFQPINRTRITRLNADQSNLKPGFARSEIRRNLLSVKSARYTEPTSISCEKLDINYHVEESMTIICALLLLHKSYEKKLTNLQCKARNTFSPWSYWDLLD